MRGQIVNVLEVGTGVLIYEPPAADVVESSQVESIVSHQGKADRGVGTVGTVGRENDCLPDVADASEVGPRHVVYSGRAR